MRMKRILSAIVVVFAITVVAVIFTALLVSAVPQGEEWYEPGHTVRIKETGETGTVLERERRGDGHWVTIRKSPEVSMDATGRPVGKVSGATFGFREFELEPVE